MKLIVTVYKENLSKELILKNNWTENLTGYTRNEVVDRLVEKFKIDLRDIEFPSNKGVLSPIYEGRKGDEVFHVRVLN